MFEQVTVSLVQQIHFVRARFRASLNGESLRPRRLFNWPVGRQQHRTTPSFLFLLANNPRPLPPPLPEQRGTRPQQCAETEF